MDYSLDLPVSIKYYSHDNMLEVTPALYDETYRVAKYLKDEFNYDSVPFDRMGKLDQTYKALLFTEQAHDKVEQVDEPTPSRIYGACLFSELPIKGDMTYWKLEWIWFHPFFRHRGNLKKHWNDLETRFGDFLIGKPISNDMTCFLEKIGSTHRCI